MITAEQLVADIRQTEGSGFALSESAAVLKVQLFASVAAVDAERAVRRVVVGDHQPELSRVAS